LTPALLLARLVNSRFFADGQRIAQRGGNWFTRSFGGGYPNLDSVVNQLEKRRGSGVVGSSHAATPGLFNRDA
jgi:hypothetical protein